MRLRRSLLVVSIIGIAGSGVTAATTPDSATVPLHVELNRPYVELTFHRTNGATRTARFVVDSGGGGFLMVESLARDLGLKWDKTIREEGSEIAQPSVPPVAFVGGMPLDLDTNRVMVLVGSERIAAPGARAEGLFPSHLLARYHVIFDYPNGKFTIARPAVLKPQGKALPMPVSRRSGFPRTEIEVDGMTYGFLLDTGASFTMVSEVLLKSWGDKHSDWPRHKGAYGEAVTLGGQTLETMFVPGGRWGEFPLAEFGVTSQREGTFEKMMSGMMTAPIVGSLAGNVLKRFRVELDYPNEKLYLSTP